MLRQKISFSASFAILQLTWLALTLPAGCSSDDAGDTGDPAGEVGGAAGGSGAAGAGGHKAGAGGQGASGTAGGGASGANSGGKSAGGAAGSGNAGGAAGSGPAGGAAGQAGSGQAGMGMAGSGQAGSGQAGSGQAGGGQAGMGMAGMAGQGPAGGQAGMGMAGAGGKGSLDALIAGMEPNSWKEIPGSAMSQVCPPTGNHYPCDAVVSAWSGGAFDEANDRLVVFGGGHSDSYYNNVFTFDLGTGSWQRWTELPVPLQTDQPPAVFLDKRIETCGLYPAVDTISIPDEWLTETGYLQPDKCEDPSIVPQLDPQQPRSTHTYGNIAFSQLTGRFYVLGSAAIYPSGQSGTSRVMGYDFTEKKWIRAAGNAQLGYGASATDGNGHIWYLGHDGGPLSEFDPMADAWKLHQAESQGFYYAGADVDRTRQHLVLTQDGIAVTTYDLTQPDAAPQKPATSGGQPITGQAPGFVYLDSLDRFVAWSGGRTLRWLDPVSWAWKSAEGGGDDPGPAAQNGTFGRFRYSPKHNVFLVLNAASTNVFLFKPPAGAL